MQKQNTMKFKVAFFLLIFVFSFVTSCRTSRQVVQKSDTKETIKENVVSYTDTTLFTPVSKTQLKIPIGLLQFNDSLNSNKLTFKPQTFSQKNGNATVKIRVKHDTILVEAKCDSLALVAKIKQQYRSELNNATQTSDNQEIRTKGVSVFKTILFIVLAFIIGFGVAFLLKTFKII